MKPNLKIIFEDKLIHRTSDTLAKFNVTVVLFAFSRLVNIHSICLESHNDNGKQKVKRIIKILLLLVISALIYHYYHIGFLS